MDDPEDRRELRALARRIRLGLFARASACGLTVLCVFAGVSLVAIRVLWPELAVRLRPEPVWAAVLVLPLCWAVWCARAPIDPMRLRAWLDRKLGLGSLLLSEREVDASAWKSQIESGLTKANGSMPGLGMRPWLERLGPALVLAGVAVLLPPPVVPAIATASRMKVDAVRDLRERIEKLAERGVIDDAKTERLRKRLEGLERALATGKEVAWADVDSLDAKLARERARHGAALEKARARFAELGRGGGKQSARELREEIAKAWNEAKREGAAIEPGKPGVTPGALPPSTGELTELARKLGDAARARLEELARTGLIDPEVLARLGRQPAGREAPRPPQHRHGPECAGGT